MHGEIRIVYSKGFIRNNLFKQLSYNNLKIMLFVIAYISFIAIFFGEFYSYIANYNINKLKWFNNKGSGYRRGSSGRKWTDRRKFKI